MDEVMKDNSSTEDQKEIEEGEIEDLPESSGDFRAIRSGFVEPCVRSLDEVDELDQSGFSRNDETNELVIDESALSLNVNESVHLPKEENLSDIVSGMCDLVASEVARATAEVNTGADTMLPDVLADPDDDEQMSDKMETSPVKQRLEEFREETATSDEATSEESKSIYLFFNGGLLKVLGEGVGKDTE
jgi:hypothetical protein